MMEVDRLRYKEFAGIRVVDPLLPVRMTQFATVLHMQRAAYVATCIESPYWGVVQSYDNAGISAGPFHWIARFPKNGNQGPLFPFLRFVMDVASDGLVPFTSMLEKQSWFIAVDGRLRRRSDGTLVSGDAFRDVVAPEHGKVPEIGPYRQQATDWAIALHKALADEHTYGAQIKYAIKYLCEGQGQYEKLAYSRMLGRTVEAPELLREEELNEGASIAMCLYHAHSVNAPAPALACLKQALAAVPAHVMAHDQVETFARTLIRALARKRYGNWEKRYEKTRLAMIKVRLWENAAEWLPEKP